jgi:aspartyl/asparaginyl beta-hydroxylase (cupin superfamily)
MDTYEQEKFLKNLENSINFLKEEYRTCKDKAFGFWDFENPKKRISHWKTTILWWKGKPFSPVQKLVPETVKLLSNGPSHRATGWMELDPHSTVPLHHHKDWNNSLILHVPLIIPEGDLGFCVEGKPVYRWKANELYAFDANLEHCAYNNTDESRVILGLDFDSSWRNVLESYMN